MDNSGDGPLQVPGFNGVPLYYELPRGSRFAHGIADWRQSPQLTLREVCMLQFMSYVTEQPDWENKCDDPDTLEIWREKADSAFDLDQPCWDWCRKELQDKAADFKRKGHVAVFDADSRVIKAEVDASLLADLRTAMEPLFSSTEKPDSEDKEALVEAGVQGPIRHVVDPSMYPLVYGRTRVLINGGKVDLDSFESCDNSLCQTAPIPDKLTKHPYELNHEERDPDDGRATNKPKYWSNKFQWLPCEVKFTNRGETKITSYINGVNPREKETYRALEKLIATAIQPWNEMLILGNQGRTPIRIRTYDFQTENEALPQAYNLLWGTTVGLKVRFSEEQWPEIRSQVRDYLNLPEYEQRYQVDPSESNVKDLLVSMNPSQWSSPAALEELIIEKHRRRYVVKGVEPGISFTYNEWKAGQNTGRAILPKVNNSLRSKNPTPPPPDPDHQFYTVSLRNQFQDLQVIIRVSGIDLIPERPLYTGEPQFGVAGILNEHIVATAVCYLDVDNIKDPKVSFQQETLLSTLDFNVEKYLIMNRVFDVPEEEDDELPPALQNLGSISVSQAGQLLSWPNTLRSRAESFTLRDPSQPGRLRFVTLWLVDPHYRICSTQNVPPQDESWVGTAMAHSQEHTQTRGSMTLAEAIDTKEQMNQERISAACVFHRYGHGAHRYADDYHAFYYGSREES
ncbi:uncharacterized protein BO95DRAFT_441568 [Aspergillus brunneoviolaceus CBS 621.78]|uniref:Uncharacterized protein n=1 Tax=Aspergillus brunneoviolaceus CBS 621.78 TaxID=1450534 RepID=A0ACD1GD82_9EURO|nr:hypothetical protein BO95DRAFT_441568 [Aspergillus brunneoviolaceus CBS 621.78]RAH47137.1 hypothetical protein BO95DRAFT_441568 [Aspergillus brunneoviolaceus CBS 621.78]